jgi:2,3-bisphosphoglycerate-dependent phosphoglycerate mutase
LPLTESLKECIQRLTPYRENEILPTLKKEETILVAAHGNSLRGIVKILKNISDENIVSLNLPTAVPYVFEFDDNMNLIKDYFL